MSREAIDAAVNAAWSEYDAASYRALRKCAAAVKSAREAYDATMRVASAARDAAVDAARRK